MNRHITRRKALTLTAAAAGAAAANLAAQTPDAKKPVPFPTRKLGRTGVSVPILGFGSGSRFCNAYKGKDDEAVAALHRAVDLGVTYFDTATSYGSGYSQRMMGEVLKVRRKEVFIATKIYGGTRDEILRNLEETLKRLQTDHVDLLHIHKLENDDEVKSFGEKGGSVETYYKLREQKIARFIGITAHTDPLPLKHFIEQYDFDCVQFALNAALQGVVRYSGGYKPDPASRPSFETFALPAALEKNMGILAMKVFGQGHLVGETPLKADAQALLRYVWSLPVASSVIGMTSLKEIEQNAAWARAFKPMAKDEMKALSARLVPANKVALDRRFANHDDRC
jgi:aryl-alcohol dehydrogenase-like predicted oxidoreductase